MAHPSDIAAASDAPTRDEERPEPLTFTLQVVSPSVGVASPLSFSHLPATTTIKELKAKIRDVLPSKPTDESQRLIHRGRMLGREADTMLDVFGHDTLGNPESQTLHLVLRPTASDGPSTLPSTATPIAGPLPVSSLPVPPQSQTRPQSTPTPPFHGMHTQQPLPGFQLVQQHQMLHQAEHAHNVMAQRLQQLQRETQRLHQEMGTIEQRYRANPGGLFNGQQPGAGQIPLMTREGNLFQLPRIAQPPIPMPPSVQNLIAQQQRERAAEGRQGAQDGNVALPNGLGRPTASGRSSPILRPDHTTTYTREGVSPNGERWQVMVNETTTTFPTPRPGHHHHHGHQHSSGNPAVEVANVSQIADRYFHNPIPDIMAQVEARARAAQAARLGGNMERSASNPVSGPAQSDTVPGAAPSVTTGGMATPTTTNSSPSASTILNPSLNTPLPTLNVNSPATVAVSSLNTSEDPMVYILSSPSGPRALLVTNSDTFFTLRQSRSRRTGSPVQDQGHAQARGAVGLPEFRNRHAGRGARRNARQERENPLVPIAAPHANPEAGALGAQVGPMLWLIARLVGFVWFFTSGNPSWTRWLMVSGLALVVFIINTGIFNGFANQIWAPIRGHLEALIPLAGPDAALVPAANAAAIPQAGVPPPAGNEAPIQGGRRGELDPAQVAARLIAQHRQQNGGWLMAHIRRAEHSLLLFLASLIPGVGERHIAAREAEASAAEAERRRQVEAAAAAANPEGNGNGGETTQAEGGTGAVAESQENREDQLHNAENRQPEDRADPAPPLIEV